MYNVLDLFCGCGGMSNGFEQAGYNILLGIDCWETALKTFKKNHKNAHTLLADLANFDPSSLKLDESVDVIIGGPPCQGFSLAGKRDVNDPRNKLYQAFVKTVAYFKPKAFVLENVPNLVSMGGGIIKDSILHDFESLGYKVVYKVLTASDFGVPQRRRRVFFVGLLEKDKVFTYPEANQKEVTTYEALSDLPEESLIDGAKYVMLPMSAYQAEMRTNSIGVFNHQTSMHSEKTKQIIALVPDGGNYKDLPKELQGTRNVHIAWTRFNSAKPSNTIDTGHRHHFHYKYNRIPTVRESARLQSFADSFEFLGSKTDQYKQVGNAVPPKLAKSVAVQLKVALS